MGVLDEPVETWFVILTRAAIRRGNFRSVRERAAMIDVFTRQWNDGYRPVTGSRPPTRSSPRRSANHEQLANRDTRSRHGHDGPIVGGDYDPLAGHDVASFRTGRATEAGEVGLTGSMMQNPEGEPGTGRVPERVAAVVLNWNGWRDTVACLESLRRQDPVPKVIVVDNGSTDGSRDRIRAEAPWAHLVQLSANRGFSGGMNAGISAALGESPVVDYVWVLNNDTLAEPLTLPRMVALADSDSKIGIVGSRLVEADGSGRIQALGGAAVNRWLGTTSNYGRPPAKGYDYLCGASLLVRRALLCQLGGFDERYFFYLEDTDFSLRAKRAGWRLAVAEDATVIHRRGASISAHSSRPSVGSDVNFARSSAIFVSSLGLPWKITAIPLRLAGMLANRLARAQADRVIPITRAYLEGLRIGRRRPEIPTF